MPALRKHTQERERRFRGSPQQAWLCHLCLSKMPVSFPETGPMCHAHPTSCFFSPQTWDLVHLISVVWVLLMSRVTRPLTGTSRHKKDWRRKQTSDGAPNPSSSHGAMWPRGRERRNTCPAYPLLCLASVPPSSHPRFPSLTQWLVVPTRRVQVALNPDLPEQYIWDVTPRRSQRHAGTHKHGATHARVQTETVSRRTRNKRGGGRCFLCDRVTTHACM
jgi:hypothetical protein